MHPLAEEEDLNLICGMEDEMLKRQPLYFYNKQTRRDVAASHVEHVILGANDDDLRVYSLHREEGLGLITERYLMNVPDGICHYFPDSEPWVRPKLKLLYLPDQPASIGI